MLRETIVGSLETGWPAKLALCIASLRAVENVASELEAEASAEMRVLLRDCFWVMTVSRGARVALTSCVTSAPVSMLDDPPRIVAMLVPMLVVMVITSTGIERTAARGI